MIDFQTHLLILQNLLLDLFFLFNLLHYPLLLFLNLPLSLLILDSHFFFLLFQKLHLGLFFLLFFNLLLSQFSVGEQGKRQGQFVFFYPVAFVPVMLAAHHASAWWIYITWFFSILKLICFKHFFHLLVIVFIFFICVLYLNFLIKSIFLLYYASIWAVYFIYLIIFWCLIIKLNFIVLLINILLILKVFFMFYIIIGFIIIKITYLLIELLLNLTYIL